MCIIYCFRYHRPCLTRHAHLLMVCFNSRCFRLWRQLFCRRHCRQQCEAARSQEHAFLSGASHTDTHSGPFSWLHCKSPKLRGTLVKMVSTMLTRHVPVTPQASLCSNILPPVHWHRHRPPSAALHSPRSQLQAPPICSIHPTVAPHVLLEVHQELVFVEEGLDMEQGWELLRRAVMQPSISSMQGAAVMSAPARFESAGSHDDSNTPSARGRVQSGPSTSNRGSPASQKGSETGSNSKGHGTPTPAASAAQQVEEARGEQKDGSSGGPGGEDPRREYLINFGKAVRTLREDLPHVLDPRALRVGGAWLGAWKHVLPWAYRAHVMLQLLHGHAELRRRCMHLRTMQCCVVGPSACVRLSMSVAATAQPTCSLDCKGHTPHLSLTLPIDCQLLQMDIYDEELLFQSQWLNLSGRSAYSRTLAMLQQTARLAFRWGTGHCSL